MQDHFFNKKTKKSHLKRKSKEAMRKAYFEARSKVKQSVKSDRVQTVGSTSAIVINGKNLVIKNLGDYQTIVCKDGKAYQINRKSQQSNNGDIGLTSFSQVMKHQEAVNLIRHLEDPQEAAEHLVRETITKMRRSNILCWHSLRVITFSA